jgi:predicted homoserine dehydrogenase-like protein
VLFGDATIAPLEGPRVEVLTVAKQDLAAGTVLDGLGGYDTYGQAEKASVSAAEKLLPIGVAESCTLRRDIGKDQAITYDDVVLPEGRLVDQLRDEQAELFPA